MEHEFFFLGRFGSLARQGSSSLIFDFQLPNSYPSTIPFLAKKCFKNDRKIKLITKITALSNVIFSIIFEALLD